MKMRTPAIAGLVSVLLHALHGHRKGLLSLAICLLPIAATSTEVNLREYDPACEINVTKAGENAILVEWSAGGTARCRTELDLAPDRPLFKSLDFAAGKDQPFSVIAADVRLRHDVIIGTRGPGERGEDDGPYIFFDKVDRRPHQRHTARLDPHSAKVASDGPARASIVISSISAGSFAGDLVLRFYSGSPFIHIDAAMTTKAPKVAYLYETLLGGDFPKVTHKSNTTDEFVTEAPPEKELARRKVRNRTIMAAMPKGTLAIFPPPHAYIYPTDFSDNLGFVQVGRERGTDYFGLKSHPRGDNRFRPWIDAPAGATQHMACFLLLSAASPEQTFQRVAEYTHGDTFKEIPGHVTFANHFHARLTVTDGTENPANFRDTMMALNVKTVQLAEFHGDGNASDTGEIRLKELKAMFEVCRKYSVPGSFTLIPGEESNTGFPGHSMYFFPKPVYLARKREKDQSYKETISGYGEVFRVGSRQDMMNVLRDNGGIIWTTHPRIKASHSQPDSYFDCPEFKDDRVFFGGDWKAMPLDLSKDRLGTRSLKLLDDMNQLGLKKGIIGEVDVFQIDRTHELYAHMNVNYVKLASVPPASDWSALHQAIREFRYFTSTGEVLIHSWSVSPARDSVSAEVEWTFPLAFAEVVWGEGNQVKRAKFPLPDTRELAGKPKRFSWPVDLTKAIWVRFEAWDIARNGAFTPTVWQ